MPIRIRLAAFAQAQGLFVESQGAKRANGGIFAPLWSDARPRTQSPICSACHAPNPKFGNKRLWICSPRLRRRFYATGAVATAATKLTMALWGTAYGQKYSSENVETMFAKYRHEIGVGAAFPLPTYLTATYRRRFARNAVGVSAMSNPLESLYALTANYHRCFVAGRWEVYWGAGLYGTFTPRRAYNALSRERYYLNLTVKQPLPSSADTTFARYIHYAVDARRSSAWGAGALLTLGARWRIPKRYALGIEISPLAYGFTYLNVARGEKREIVKTYLVGEKYVEERRTESETPEGTRVRRIVGDFPLHLIYPKIFFSVYR
ncbi:MAG: hypothetical protein RMM53_00110 [Bacteroidia bacterium]|nr:hypothetical protein [Bacteroidia bacterium]